MKYAGYIATFFIAVIVAVGLSIVSMGVFAESSEGEDVKPIDQGTLCVASSDEQALDCPEGGLFMARLAINNTDAQNPLVLENRVLNTMALYCDTNFSIQHTQAGVLCVLTHQRIGTGSEEEIDAEEIEGNS
ncbi:hypothetical protein [Halomonas sp. SpR8]|uniref:hypothetical protein n=1 Tax=Halomonas sp. SpR8 TaxID=3050463 RepID=UPI0027E3D35C|nr:hypothetical protein [Halomonas sp. SpR8]MDQ7730283.1 hypothetical protein [Halomonas sp. SpR8]